MKDFMKAIYFAVRCPKKPKVAPPMTSPAAIEIKAMVASAFLNKLLEVMLMVRVLSMKTVDIMIMLTKRELGNMMRKKGMSKMGNRGTVIMWGEELGRNRIG